MNLISISTDIGVSKKNQIISSIEAAICNRKLKKGDKLPSINSIRNRYPVSRDTILDAYAELKMRGVVQSVAGKGYYLIKENIDTIHKVFLLFDEFNAFKENLYNAFIRNLKPITEVDVFFHHFNYEVFRTMIINNAGNYFYYVIMPANLQNTGLIVDFLPKEKVYILDQMHNDLLNYSGIYQNFRKGMADCLEKLKERILTYSKFILLFDCNKQPKAIRSGFESFCVKNDVSFEVLYANEELEIKKGYAYMVLDDKALIYVMSQMKSQKLKLIEDIGIVAYNDTQLKEVVADGITVISTDFYGMGKKLAQMITRNRHEKIENEIVLTLRNSI